MSKERHPWQWFIERQSDYDLHMYAVSCPLYSGKTKYQRVDIFETAKFGKMLVLDGDPQSLQSDESLYHEVLVHPAMLTHPNPKQVLVLGGGEGATLREVLKHNTVEEILMVDLDEELVSLCKEHLKEWAQGSFEDSRVKVLYRDAFAFLRENKLDFDVIISDLTEPLPESPTHQLYNKMFFELVLGNLNSDGIFVMQASRVTSDRNSLHLDHYRLMREIFPVVQTSHVYIPSFFSDWGFIAGSAKLDPAAFSSGEVDNAVKTRISGTFRHYDGEVHKGLFSLPQDLRRDYNESQALTVAKGHRK